jgi:formylglycine-generating enzyme required for sulfatase activity
MPWTDITGHSAAAECESLGAGYGLISNSEWMAIARDAEVQGENWTGQAIGTGCFYRGNSGEGTIGIGTTNGDSCGYTPVTNPDSGTGRDLRARHKLSTGDFMYDMAGNSWEWIDWDPTIAGFQLAPTTCAASHTELPAVACGALSDADYNSSTGTYDSTIGFGRFYGGTGGGAFRGGSQSGSLSGIYTVWFFATPAMSFGNGGLRCVYRP